MGSNGLISRIPGRPNTVGLGQLSVTAYIRTNGFLSGRLPSYQPNHASVEIRMHKSLIPCRSVADSDVQDFSVLATAASSASGTSWSEFSERASGEWEGVLVTFRPDGHAEEIPPYYVPQAYRDWDMQLYDWQAQCSMLADDRGLGYLTRRLMPTVGCEADAIAFEEERQVVIPDPASPNVAIFGDGSFSAAPVKLAASGAVQRLEHCFVEEEDGFRIRLALVVVAGEAGWRLVKVEMVRERYDSPYKGALDLSGCGGGGTPFSQTPRTSAQDLEGPWRILQSSCSPGSLPDPHSMESGEPVVEIRGEKGCARDWRGDPISVCESVKTEEWKSAEASGQEENLSGVEKLAF